MSTKARADVGYRTWSDRSVDAIPTKAIGFTGLFAREARSAWVGARPWHPTGTGTRRGSVDRARPPSAAGRRDAPSGPRPGRRSGPGGTAAAMPTSACRISSGSASTIAWSPAVTRSTTRQSSQASVPSRSGTPYGPVRQPGRRGEPVDAAGREGPGQLAAGRRRAGAPPRAGRGPPSASSTSADVQAERHQRRVQRHRGERGGGEADRRGTGAVTTTTVLAWWRSSVRSASASASTGGGRWSGSVI